MLGFPLISLGNELHHMLNQASADVTKGRAWTRRDTSLM